MKNQLVREIAQRLVAIENCRKSGNAEWLDKHTQTIGELVNQFMPSGSGVDNGTKIDLEASEPNKLVFYASYHHMNANGFYDGWTEHTITVKPDLAFGISLTISGRDRNEIKEYLHEIFHGALTAQIEWKEQDHAYAVVA